MPVDKQRMHGVARRSTAPAPGYVELRGPSGRLYGMLDPHKMIVEFRQGRDVERIDLSVYRRVTDPDIS